jgi:hypothetical protein
MLRCDWWTSKNARFDAQEAQDELNKASEIKFDTVNLLESPRTQIRFHSHKYKILDLLE